MKTYTMALAFVIGLVGGVSGQEPVDLTIATGKAGGGYDKAAQTLGKVIGQRGYSYVVDNYNGSKEISLKVCNNQANLGFMQIDALYAREMEGCTLEVIASYGAEYAMMFVPPKSNIDELSDLTSSDKIIVDTVGSGSELWWDTVVGIETGDEGSGDDWATAQVLRDTKIIQAFALSKKNGVSAVIVVNKPNSDNIKKLLKAGWQLVELYDKDINDLQYNNGPLYDSLEVEVGESDVGFVTNWSYKVESFIAANEYVIDNSQLYDDLLNETNK